MDVGCIRSKDLPEVREEGKGCVCERGGVGEAVQSVLGWCSNARQGISFFLSFFFVLLREKERQLRSGRGLDLLRGSHEFGSFLLFFLGGGLGPLWWSESLSAVVRGIHPLINASQMVSEWRRRWRPTPCTACRRWWASSRGAAARGIRRRNASAGTGENGLNGGSGGSVGSCRSRRGRG